MSRTRYRVYMEKVKAMKANLLKHGGQADICRMSTHVYEAFRKPDVLMGMVVIADPAMSEGEIYIGPKENEEVKPNAKG
jgi:hypothetical protein